MDKNLENGRKKAQTAQKWGKDKNILPVAVGMQLWRNWISRLGRRSSLLGFGPNCGARVAEAATGVNELMLRKWAGLDSPQFFAEGG